MKLLLIFTIFVNLLFSSPVMDRVKEFVDRKSFRQYYSLIRKMFIDEDKFMVGNRVDVISIIERLKANGILRLYLSYPRSIQITFQGGGEPLLFLKIISDTLQELGYFKYKVLETSFSSSGFSLKIEFVSDYILDPTLLYESLHQKGCEIIDINRRAFLSWKYTIDTSSAFLNVQHLNIGEKIKLKTPVFDYWFQIDKGSIIEFISVANNWHPYIVFYDKKLNILNIFKRDRKNIKLRLKIPKGTAYIKVTDIYLLNNLKNGLRVSLE